jgi:DNA-directed RNA polymerase specialized sigma24 family protein
MGAVSVDLNKRERLYEARYPLDNPFGVRHLFEDYDKLRDSAYSKGDYDALHVMIDFKDAVDNANLTQKQKDALHYVYDLGYTQEDAADALGYASHTAVNNLIDRAINRIAEAQGFDEEVYIEKHGH